MGLAERRAATDFETQIYPELKKQIDAAAGFEVPVEVRWDTMMRQEKYVKGWKENWPKLYFKPIVAAFQAICIDEMGKSALKEILKKVVIQDTKSSHSSNWAEFDKATGTLTLDHQYTNVSEEKSRADIMRNVLERAM